MAKLGNDTLICSGIFPSLKATGGDYLWSTGQTDSMITLTKGGTYWVAIKN
jgi:hypothetical protein